MWIIDWQLSCLDSGTIPQERTDAWHCGSGKYTVDMGAIDRFRELTALHLIKRPYDAAF